MVKLRRMKNFLNSRVITGTLTTAVMLLSIAWYINDGGYEPLIASVAGVLGFLSLFKYSFLSFDKNLTADRIALVVGNYSYPFGMRLPGAKNDVEAVCKSLKAKGFRMIRRENPSSSDLRKAIYDFQVILSTGGVGVFYYAGHAAQIDGRDFILPVDASTVDSREDFFRHAIDLNDLLGPIDKIIEESPDHNGSVIIYSTASGALALDETTDSKGQSPFASSLLELMERWNFELFDLFRELCKRVSFVTGGKQVPWLAASLDVEFYFKPIVKEKIGLLKILVFDACRNNPLAGTRQAAIFAGRAQPEFSPTGTRAVDPGLPGDGLSV
jgi:hypothetical protein